MFCMTPIALIVVVAASVFAIPRPQSKYEKTSDPSATAAMERLNADLWSVLATVPSNKCTQSLVTAKYDKAWEECTRLIWQSPGSNIINLAALHFFRAHAQFHLDHTTNAHADLNAALELSKEPNVACMRLRGVILTIQGRHGPAYDDFKATGETRKEIGAFLLALIVHYEHRKDHEYVIRVCSQLLMWSRSDSMMAARAHFGRGIAYAATQQYPAAIKDYETTIPLWSRHPKLGHVQVLLATLLEDDLRAKALMEKGMRKLKNPDDAYFIGLAMFKLGDISLRSGLHAKSLKYFVHAVSCLRVPGLEALAHPALLALVELTDAFNQQLVDCHQDQCAVCIIADPIDVQEINLHRAVILMLGLQIKSLSQNSKTVDAETDEALRMAVKEFVAATSTLDVPQPRNLWVLAANTAQALAGLGEFRAAKNVLGELAQSLRYSRETAELKRRVHGAAKSGHPLSVAKMRIAI